VNAIVCNRACPLAHPARDAVCPEFFVAGFDEVGQHGRGTHTQTHAEGGRRGAEASWQDRCPLQSGEGPNYGRKRSLRQLLGSVPRENPLCLSELLRGEAVGVYSVRMVAHPDFAGPSQNGLGDCLVTRVILDGMCEQSKHRWGPKKSHLAAGDCFPLEALDKGWGCVCGPNRSKPQGLCQPQKGPPIRWGRHGGGGVLV
jgi:hypothetical protein